MCEQIVVVGAHVLDPDLKCPGPLEATPFDDVGEGEDERSVVGTIRRRRHGHRPAELTPIGVGDGETHDAEVIGEVPPTR